MNDMKKSIALLMGTILCFSLMACDGTGESTANSTTNSTVGEQEESLIETQYLEIKEYLNNLSVVYDYESEQGLTGQDALHFAYTWFNEHSDYKDCADYLVNFTVVDDALTKITKQATDAFGQVEESIYTTYSYDENGKCFQLSDLYDTFEFINVIGVSEGVIKDCQYNHSGKMVSAELYGGLNEDSIGLKINIVYDERGNLVESNFIQYDGKSWSNTYTYNESNRLLTKKVSGVFTCSLVFVFWEPYYSEYQYNEQGNLAKIIRYRYNNVFDYVMQDQYTFSEYTYNEDGQIKEIKTFTHTPYPNQEWKNVYTYDEKGRISYIEYIPLGTTSGLPYKLTYHYEDIIVYTKN